jgi:predicted dehydrogenase
MSNVIVIGAGGIGERHVRCFQSVGAHVGIVETNAERRGDVAARYRCEAYASWEEARAAKDWQAGVVASPAPSHIPIALELAGAGLNVLIEKPLALDMAGVDELRRFDSVRKIRIAYVLRHMELLLELKKRLDAGRFGRALTAEIVSGEDFSIARPDYARIYYARHETGGGAIQDILTHYSNAMDWLVGPVQEVTCMAANRKLTNVSVEDTVSCAARHEGGCLANYFVFQGQAPKEVSFTIHCETGSFKADFGTTRIGEFASRADAWAWTQLGPFERDDFFIAQARAFLHGVPDGRESTLEEGIHSLKVLSAALESVRARKVVEISR